MGLRADLQALLLTLCDNVYFQPPSNLTMTYPAIVYRRDHLRDQFADNGPYLRTTRYSVSVIDRNPDSEIPAKVAALPLCAFDRFFVANNLNHDLYILYF